MSEGLLGSASVPLTVVGPNSITAHAEEIERLIVACPATPTSLSDPDQPSTENSFALEKHLEEFLVSNWKSTEDFQILEIETQNPNMNFRNNLVCVLFCFINTICC